MTVTAQAAPGARGSGRTRRLGRSPARTTASHYLIWAVTLVLVVGPVVPIVLASLWSTPLYQSGGHLTLINYRDLLTDGAWWGAVGNSAVFAGLTTVLSVLFGVTTAVLLTRTDVPWRRLFTGVLILPVVLPGLVLIVGWMAMWSPSGYVSSWLQVNMALSFPIDLYTMPGMALVATSVAAPVVFLFCRTTVLAVDSALEDAARSSGAGPIRALVWVVVPLLRPSSTRRCWSSRCRSRCSGSR
jgi:iron(III) transport system permease protein